MNEAQLKTLVRKIQNELGEKWIGKLNKWNIIFSQKTGFWTPPQKQITIHLREEYITLYNNRKPKDETVRKIISRLEAKDIPIREEYIFK